MWDESFPLAERDRVTRSEGGCLSSHRQSAKLPLSGYTVASKHTAPPPRTLRLCGVVDIAASDCHPRRYSNTQLPPAGQEHSFGEF